MLLTLKQKIKPDNKQISILNKMSDECRDVYNYFLNQKIEYYKQNNKNISYYIQQKQLKNYKTKIIAYDLKKEVLRTLDANFRSFYQLKKSNSKANIPSFRSRDYFFTISSVQSFIIKNNKIVITLQKKHFSLDIDYCVPIKNLLCTSCKSTSDIKQLKIYKQNNEYYISIVYDKKEQINETKDVISIDLGKKNLVTMFNPQSNSGIICNSENLNKITHYFDKRIDEIKSLRDKKKKKSRKWNHLNNKLTKLFNKKKQQINLILHKLSKEIANMNINIAVGELTNLKEQTKSFRRINRQMFNNWSIATFVRLLEYKTLLKGNKVTKVNEAWTSKTCCKCGSINQDLDLKDRNYECDCGLKIDRDINGAINIYKQYLGDYSTPVDIFNLKISERFDWCKFNQMNKFNL